MHVARGHDGLSKRFSQLDDGAVERAELLFVLGLSFFQHEGVVAQRLNLEKIIERRDALELGKALVRHDGLKQLARLAGRADDQPLAPSEQLGLRDDGIALEVFQVAVGDQPVEVSQANGIFGKEDDVPRAAVQNLRARAKLGHDGIDLRERMHALFLQHLPEAHHHVSAGDGVVGRAVVVEFRQAQGVRHDIELVLAQLRQHVLRQDERVDVRRLEREAQPLRSGGNKADVKIGVVRTQRPSRHKTEKLRQCFGDIRRADKHLVGDASELDDLRRELAARRNEGLKGIEHLAAAHHCGADFNDDIVLGRKARRLKVKCDVFRVKRRVDGAVDGDAVVHIVDIISLAAVQNLDVLIRARDLGLAGGLQRIRERLRAAVIRDGDGAVSPRRRLLHGSGRIGQRVHGRHCGVQMQLHALFLCRVHAFWRGDTLNGIGLHDHLVVIAVKGHLALNAHPHAGLDVVKNWLGLVVFHELVDTHRAGVVRHIEADHPRAALFELAVLHGEDLAAHNHAEHVEIKLGHPDRLAAERPAKEHVAGRLLRRRSSVVFSRLRARGRGKLHLFDRLAADALGLVKKCPALELRAGDEREFRLHAEVRLQKFLRPRCVLFQLLLAVCGQADGHPLARQLKFCPGKARRGRRPGAHKHADKVGRLQRTDRLRRVVRQNGKTLQAIPVRQHGLKLLDFTLRYVMLRFQIYFNASGPAVDLRAGNLRAADALRQLRLWKQL